MPLDFIGSRNEDFQQVIDFLRNDIAALRTGRANPSMLANVMVEAYGTMNPITAVASISAPDARSLLVEPWDKSIVKDIEKSILEAKLGLNPVVQGAQIRVPLPALTEESRKALVKTLGEKCEHARKSVRNVREEIKTDVLEAEKAKEISEDDKYRTLEQLDKTAAGWNEKIKHIAEEKEKEIMTM